MSFSPLFVGNKGVNLIAGAHMNSPTSLGHQQAISHSPIPFDLAFDNNDNDSNDNNASDDDGKIKSFGNFHEGMSNNYNLKLDENNINSRNNTAQIIYSSNNTFVESKKKRKSDSISSDVSNSSTSQAALNAISAARAKNYACSKCGQPKKGHVCPQAPVLVAATTSSSTQIDYNTDECERIITTRRYRPYRPCASH